MINGLVVVIFLILSTHGSSRTLYTLLTRIFRTRVATIVVGSVLARNVSKDIARYNAIDLSEDVRQWSRISGLCCY